MSTQPPVTGKPPSEADLRAAALEFLRTGSNPFASQVAAVGTAEENVLAGVPELTASQLSELLDVVDQYRTGRPATRAYPLLGERGAGKTHLLYELRSVLRQRAAESGDETLVIVVERLSPGMDAVDYLLWQIVNHLLAQKGEGGRMLGVIAGRVTARLLAESLRKLPPHQRVELFPADGVWSRIGIGRGRKVQARLDAVEDVIQRCDAKHPSSEELRDACGKAGLNTQTAVQVVEQHLDRTESNDVLGWFRQELYTRLARVALLRDRVPFEELHVSDFEQAPANVKNAGSLNRRLLDTWLELLSVLNIPVVVVFDQLEDYLRHPDPERAKHNRQFFTDATARFINELRNVCILIFAEQGYWTQLINNAEGFTRERLTQPFALPGRPAKAFIEMPTKVEPEILERIIQARIRYQFPDLDLTGLPPHFPFEPADLKKLKAETTVRACLRRLAPRYDQIVYQTNGKSKTDGGEKDKEELPDLKKRLTELWREQLAVQSKEFGEDLSFSTAFIPEVQNALDAWLQCLFLNGLTGTGPWHKVELVTDTKKGQYGYLSVVRTNGPNLPGIGIGVWLGQNKGRPLDLRQRVAFFKQNPCPIRTLVMLRADGEAALSGETREEYEKSVKAGRDVRIQKYEPRHLHALMAFAPWNQAATAEAQVVKESTPDADAVLRGFIADVSNELLGWIDDWRQPPTLQPPKGALV